MTGIDNLIKDALSAVEKQAEDTQKMGMHPLSTMLRKLAAEVRQQKKSFTTEELQPIIGLVKTAQFVDDAALIKRAENAFWLGFTETNRVFDLDGKDAGELKKKLVKGMQGLLGTKRTKQIGKSLGQAARKHQAQRQKQKDLTEKIVGKVKEKLQKMDFKNLSKPKGKFDQPKMYETAVGK